MTDYSKIQNCPVCDNSYLTLRDDIYKDKRLFVYCDVCGACATLALWQMVKPDQNSQD